MKLLCSLILIFIMSFNVQAQAINGEFKPADTISQVKEGDLFEATLRFWPIENADMGQFKKLEKQVLFNAYYMAQILSLAPSDNNADVVELRALFIVKSSKIQPVDSAQRIQSPLYRACCMRQVNLLRSSRLNGSCFP